MMWPVHADFVNVSRLTGVSVYKIKKWFADGLIQSVTADAVSDYARRNALANSGELDYQTAVFMLGHDEQRLKDLMDCGAVLPLSNGRFVGLDFIEVKARRFAVLPARPDYKPTRPCVNTPLVSWSLAHKGFQSSLDRRRAACSYWTFTPAGAFCIADGYYCNNKQPAVSDVWRVTLRCRPMRHSDVITADADGLQPRIFIQAWTAANITVCNLGMLDDWGVMARAHGVYHKSYQWQAALYRAVREIGLDAQALSSIDAELQRLADWLNNVNAI